jgi:hypothetical protein
MGGHLGEQRPDLAALGLRFGQRLAVGGAAGVLVEGIDVDRGGQAVALGVADRGALEVFRRFEQAAYAS